MMPIAADKLLPTVSMPSAFEAEPSLAVTPAPETVADDRIAQLRARLEPLSERLGSHPLYREIRSLDDVQVFLESHVFAVWDFMSLLKALQRGLTCVEVPWRPSALPEARRFINEIVLGEESDVYEGAALSHFELYRQAMLQCGASTEAIDALLYQLEQGDSLAVTLDRVRIPEAARAFVRSTFAVIDTGDLHVIASAFTFGREDLIPDLFRAFLRDQDEQLSGRLALLRWYLDRHIEVDGDEHGPISLRMVAALCGSNPRKWQEAEQAAVAAVEARLALWDGVLADIQRRRDSRTS